MSNSRSFIQRTCVVLALIVLLVYLFYIGKGHTLLLDTNAVTINNEELRAYASTAVSVNGKAIRNPMGRAQRVSVTVMGPKHTIVISDTANADNIVERTLIIPTFVDRIVVSIPAIIGDAPVEHWLVPFVPPSLADAPIERMQPYIPPGGAKP
jgi:hypothetical protein